MLYVCVCWGGMECVIHKYSVNHFAKNNTFEATFSFVKQEHFLGESEREVVLMKVKDEQGVIVKDSLISA